VFSSSDIFTINGLEMFIGFGAAFFLGLLAWRVWWIGRSIAQTVTKFDLRPQFKHPDRCGGLEPLGLLCLWNAFIVSIPCIFLGSWILVLRTPTLFQGSGSQALSEGILRFISFYGSLFPELLVIFFAFALIIFFLPMWAVHRVMVAKADSFNNELEQLASHIEALARQILHEARYLELETVDEYEKKIKELELLQATYERNRYIPVWPFNLPILLRFAILQVVPVLSWGQPILNLLNSVLTRTKAQ
jgi:hypothetical protein